MENSNEQPTNPGVGSQDTEKEVNAVVEKMKQLVDGLSTLEGEVKNLTGFNKFVQLLRESGMDGYVNLQVALSRQPDEKKGFLMQLLDAAALSAGLIQNREDAEPITRIPKDPNAQE